MIEPWDRRRTRLGIHWGARTRSREQGIGWALLDLAPPTFLERGRVATPDPIEAALVRARQAVLDGVEGIVLYRYASDGSFAGSRASEDGLSRKEHKAMIDELAARMRAEGLPVTIETVV